MNGVTLPQPAVKLVEKFAALRLGDLRFGRAFRQRTKGVERGEIRSERRLPARPLRHSIAVRLARDASSSRFQLRFLLIQFNRCEPAPVQFGQKIRPRMKNGSFSGICRAYSSAEGRVAPVRTEEKWFRAGGNPARWRVKPSISEGRVTRVPVYWNWGLVNSSLRLKFVQNSQFARRRQGDAQKFPRAKFA